MKCSLIAAAAICLSAGYAGAEVAPADVIFEDGAVMASLTGTPGDATNGRKVFANRKLGNCLACHENPDMPEQLFHGEVGPSLGGVGEFWEEAPLRALLVNAKTIFEDTMMPAFYMDTGYTRILSKFEGKTILSAQEIEDVIAYLLTLK